MTEKPNLTDEEIVGVVCDTDKEQFSKLIKRYQDKLLRYAGYLTGDDMEAGDIVQESFIKAYINLKGFDRKKKFSSWIYRIVHNEAMNAISKNNRQTSLYENMDFDGGVNLEDDYIKNELKLKTGNCLKRMQYIYREPIALYFLENKSYEEISDILRIPIGTVGTRINRAKLIMQKLCQK